VTTRTAVFSFAVFSDPHIFSNADDTPRTKLFLRVVAAINGLDPLFTLGTGDLRDIVSPARDVDLDFLIVTDHMSLQARDASTICCSMASTS